DLTGEAAIVQEQPEAVGRVEVPLALPGTAPRTKRFAIGHRIGGAEIGPRLPLLEPVATADADIAPRFPVFDSQWAQKHPRADELIRIRLPTRSHQELEGLPGRRGRRARCP